MSRAWRATSRLRTGSSPGGATFSTTRSPSVGPPVTRAVNVRLDAPPVTGCTSAYSTGTVTLVMSWSGPYGIS